MHPTEAKNMLEDVRLAIGRLRQIEERLQVVVAQTASDPDERPFGRIEWIMEQMPGIPRHRIYDLARAGALPGLLRRQKGGTLIVNKAAFRAGMAKLSDGSLGATGIPNAH